MQTLSHVEVNGTTAPEPPRSGVKAASSDEDTLRRSAVWMWAGGMTDQAVELQETLAEAAGMLRALGSVDVECSEERRHATRRELAAILLGAFELSVGFRTAFANLEKLSHKDVAA